MLRTTLHSIIYLSITAIVLNSCSSDTTEELTDTVPEVVAEEQQEGLVEQEVEEFDSIRGIYEGYIGLYEKHVVMDVTLVGDQVSGSYFYTKHQKPLSLEGTFDQASNAFKVIESYKGKETGYMEFTISKDGEIEGVWLIEDGAEEEEMVSLLKMNVAPEEYEPKFSRYEVTHDLMIFNGEENENFEATSELVINKIDHNHFSFYMHVIGGNAHVGSIEGLGIYNPTNKNTGKFYDGDLCGLDFIFNDNDVEVIEDNCGYYHGAHAYFSDTFFKVK